MRTLIALACLLMISVPALSTGDTFAPVKEGGAKGPVFNATRCELNAITFAEDGSGYITSRSEENRLRLDLYWKQGSTATRVVDEAGEPFFGVPITLQGNGKSVFAAATAKQGDSPTLYRLIREKAHLITTEDDEPFRGASFQFTGTAPEYVQVGSGSNFFRLEGNKAKRLTLPEDLPELTLPYLIASARATYLHQPATFTKDGKLWMIKDDGQLSRVRWASGEVAVLDFLDVIPAGNATFAYNIPPTDDDVLTLYFYCLDGDTLTQVMDAEEDPLFTVAGKVAVAGADRLYVQGWSVRGEGEYLWSIGGNEEVATLVMTGDEPLSGDALNVATAGDKVLVRRAVGEGEPELWVCSGGTARAIRTPDGKQLRGNAPAAFFKQDKGLLVVMEDRIQHLYSVDADYIARPAVVDGEAVKVGPLPGFAAVHPIQLRASPTEIYVRLNYATRVEIYRLQD
jgi:hypothetical protein